MLRRIISERLTVRKTDEEIDKIKNEPSSDEGLQKIIEKGEINMNNDMNMMPNMTSNPTGSFDIFGSPEPAEQPVNPFISAPSQPTYNMGNNSMMNATPVVDVNNVGLTQPIAPVIEPQPINSVVQSFDIPQTPEPTGQNNSMFSLNQYNLNTPVSIENNNESDEGASQVNLNIPSVPTMPVMNGIQFDFNGTVVGEPNSVEQAQEMPQFNLNPAQSVPTMDQQTVQPMDSIGFQFDENGMVISAPTTSGQSSVPVTTPIIETPVQQPSTPTPIVPDLNSTFSFDNSAEPNPNTVSMDTPNYIQPEEIKMPEPIIITDYNKQYDPVMPQSQQVVQSKVDFKEVISAIRECSAKIEQYGYKIDLEEYDLANMYQVVFKIEK